LEGILNFLFYRRGGIYGAYIIPLSKNTLPLKPIVGLRSGLGTEVSVTIFGATISPKSDFKRFLLLNII